MSELKNRLSEFLRLVKSGEVISILEHNVPIAQIIGARLFKGGRNSGALTRLERAGLVSGSKPLEPKSLREFLRRPRLKVSDEVNLVKCIIDEREEERSP